MACTSKTMVKDQVASEAAPCSKPATVARSWAQIVRTGLDETSLASKKTALRSTSDVKTVDVLKDTELCTDTSDDEAETQVGSTLSLGSTPSENNESDEDLWHTLSTALEPRILAESFVAVKPATKLRSGAASFVPHMPAVTEGKFNVEARDFVPASGAYSTPHMFCKKDENKYDIDHYRRTPPEAVAPNWACAPPPGLQTPLRSSAARFVPTATTAYPLGKPPAFAFAEVSEQGAR